MYKRIGFKGLKKASSNRGDDKLITELNISNTEDEEVQASHSFWGGVAFASYIITLM